MEMEASLITVIRELPWTTGWSPLFQLLPLLPEFMKWIVPYPNNEFYRSIAIFHEGSFIKLVLCLQRSPHK
ncbi:hypothetical protein B5K06_33410 [Rhizobium grahamii]|uniref:Uncharacterized protein n=1 Tax=Rhizobium grahamii TaxID=1120045 RepID=A0A370KDM2_9HYPH|nr:hypothetical protein B5K06_33410 [Rhizobium grahamii]